MSMGPGRWQQAALHLLDKTGSALRFGAIAAALGATTWSDRVALRRALDRLVVIGRLGKRAGKRIFSGPSDIVWFRTKK